MRRAAYLLLITALTSAGAAETAHARHGLLTGFTDIDAFQSLGPAQTQTAFAHARGAGGSVVRLAYSWRDVVTAEPPTAAAASDPSWSGYNWAPVDRAVREATAAGLRVLLSWTGAPDWAEGRGRPSLRRAPPGTWRPSATDYGHFARAVALRYSGRYRGLPRVRYYQAWNEPNLSDFLTPQWRKRRGRYVAVSPALYRRLLNAFYAGVKSVNRSNYVVSAGTAPFAEPRRGARRMPAAYFTREFLCVRGRERPRPFRCPSSPARFNALAHHPYPIGPPRRPAINPDDVVVPDIWKLTRPLRAAIRAGKVSPRRRKPVWATEISWDTRPPDPDGIPLGAQARNLEGAFYTLWRQGVQVVTWFLMRDEARGRGYPYTLQAGIYFRGATVDADRPKPSFRAFRFPFTAYRRRGVAQLWGLAPRPGPVAIEIRSRGRWRRLISLRARSADRLFFRARRIRKGSVLRARQGSDTSLSWRVAQNVTE
jgi:cellulase (glycosyl hydrolase family 5)